MHDQSQKLRDSWWKGVFCLNFSVVLLWTDAAGTQGSYTAVLCPHVQPQLMGSLSSWMNFPCHTMQKNKTKQLAHHSAKHRPSSIELVFRASAESLPVNAVDQNVRVLKTQMEEVGGSICRWGLLGKS